MAGYSTKTLSQKLGIKANSQIVLLNHPKDYGHLLFPILAGVSVFDELHPESDIIQFFTTSEDALKKIFPKLKSHLKSDGALWISWPKKTNVIARSNDLSADRQAKQSLLSDLNENIIRDIGLANGMVDVKVIAVDETWSGLKFVVRVKDRV